MSRLGTNPVLAAALGYRAAGLSVIPVGLDGLKRPAFAVLPRVSDPARPGRTKPTWNPYRGRLAAIDELRRWFGGRGPCGIGLVCGAVSGGLECIDFDDRATARAFLGLVRARRPDLYARLSLEATPRGAHVWYRCSEIAGSRKLAWPSRQECQRLRVPFQALAETRGEGSYVVVSGSPVEVHTLRLPYRHVGGPPLTRVAGIAPAERAFLLAVAASFDRSDTRPPALRWCGRRGPGPGGASAVADYDLRGEPFSELLPGAAFSQPGEDTGFARRPGKVRGWSATVGYCRGPLGEPLLKVFTSAWPPFEPGRCYGRFHTLRLTRFGGDSAAATKCLREHGFGDQPKVAPRVGST